MSGSCRPCPPGPGLPTPWYEVPRPWKACHVPQGWYGQEDADARANARKYGRSVPSSQRVRRVSEVAATEIAMRFPDLVATAEMGSAGSIRQLFAYKNNVKDYVNEAGERDADVARSAALADGTARTLMQAWQLYVNEAGEDLPVSLFDFWR